MPALRASSASPPRSAELPIPPPTKSIGRHPIAACKVRSLKGQNDCIHSRRMHYKKLVQSIPQDIVFRRLRKAVPKAASDVRSLLTILRQTRLDLPTRTFRGRRRAAIRLSTMTSTDDESQFRNRTQQSPLASQRAKQANADGQGSKSRFSGVFPLGYKDTFSQWVS